MDSDCAFSTCSRDSLDSVVVVVVETAVERDTAAEEALALALAVALAFLG